MLGGISVWQLLIVLVIIVLIFGTKKLRNIGSDLGGALKNFKSAIKENDEPSEDQQTEKTEGRVIEGKASTSESADAKSQNSNPVDRQ